MIKNNLKIDDLYNIKNKIIFPESVISFFNGFFGIPFGGFPKKIKNIILKNNNNYIKKDFNKIKFNFNEIKNDLEKLDINNIFIEDILSYIMFPQVFLNYKKNIKKYGNLMLLETPIFLNGLKLKEKTIIKLKNNKELIIYLYNIINNKFKEIRNKILFLKVNGHNKIIEIKDEVKYFIKEKKNIKFNEEKKNFIISEKNGIISNIFVKENDFLKKNDPILIIEFMKIELVIESYFNCKIEKILVKIGDNIKKGDFLIKIKK